MNEENGFPTILISGSHGLIGSALIPFLSASGYWIRRLTRSMTLEDNSSVYWDPEKRIINPSDLEGLDAVIHLAGENIAGKRWTKLQKEKIYNSRVKGVRFLCESLSQLLKPPKILLSASAVGYYGNRDQEILDEKSPRGAGFLADLCQEWEAATEPAVRKGIRLANMRFGIILSSSGGTLAKILVPFKLGLGGLLGNGRQYVSWIAIDDVISAIDFVLMNVFIRGPVNVVSPYPVTNYEFTKTLGKVLNRPTFFTIPEFILRFVLGEMAEELLLSSQRVEPAKLIASNYPFKFPALASALKHLIPT